jgi:hypothetical protein
VTHGEVLPLVDTEGLMKEAAMLNADDRMRELESEHRILDARLRVLSKRAFLTPDEQRESAELKRKKLVAKDRLYALSRLDAG